MNYPIGQINHSYLGSSVYTMLREALIVGRLKPDDRLRIRELAAQVGTSVTPVRDAILQLAKEQALVLKTPRDIRVPQLTEEQFREIRTLRLSLEGTGAELAAQRITPQDMARMAENIQQNRLAIDKNHLREALRLNSEFHLLLAQMAQMPLLNQFIGSLWMRTGPLIAQAYTHFSLKMAIEHHHDVLNALRKRDGQAARQSIQEDILDGSETMLAFIVVEQRE
ncbi:DNA-binding GntR family transcriptional regulator|uniref:GntR family transcriptional regulator n=1 Tax=Brenneria salicis ATCC 15712 = DSM 30166 TaxID=714314 RepID=A0A366IAY4_9GAMM|nr:GntR family transcriptional regulator [Brenneria salicis]NMN91762.1 DNA-binding GntR family transcriptional regulator [Brenneria salicis ATCC 15712 = DSM 30166]RBP65828.1 GntR family transcriptional regulator [Brenneria salicis ATCC 15712 = DSM 30166]RLM31863.1 GntR family transcriptional regulator [Brenneria salicis ATCC 15712 = DSM 30166]